MQSIARFLVTYYRKQAGVVANYAYATTRNTLCHLPVLSSKCLTETGSCLSRLCERCFGAEPQDQLESCCYMKVSGPTHHRRERLRLKELLKVDHENELSCLDEYEKFVCDVCGDALYRNIYDTATLQVMCDVMVTHALEYKSSL
ncbi:hypothetical protein CalGV044 [Clostera anastomosis granulovirus A]|uniref:Uncharacterized protein n=1 Tax=Clostera anastomosis granulovirus A TaxID=1986289 RepID=U5KBK9_9BBAC|nr:hypothetical protein CalGV044 [Clostera anastomosis granulovirus Henan]AGQ20303.1 hypothetical protein CalGV044 [Clostera anastomosis granulovirus Henan]